MKVRNQLTEEVLALGKVTQYRKGYQLESDVKFLLEQQGYYVVRSAGSKRLCDLIAIPHETMGSDLPLCIQCKKTTKPDTIPRLSKEELQKLRELEENYKVSVRIAVRYRMKGRWYTRILTIKEYELLLRGVLE